MSKRLGSNSFLDYVCSITKHIITAHAVLKDNMYINSFTQVE